MMKDTDMDTEAYMTGKQASRESVKMEFDRKVHIYQLTGDSSPSEGIKYAFNICTFPKVISLCALYT